jgi:hypothetical protein
MGMLTRVRAKDCFWLCALAWFLRFRKVMLGLAWSNILSPTQSNRAQSMGLNRLSIHLEN